MLPLKPLLRKRTFLKPAMWETKQIFMLCSPNKFTVSIYCGTSILFFSEKNLATCGCNKQGILFSWWRWLGPNDRVRVTYRHRCTCLVCLPIWTRLVARQRRASFYIWLFSCIFIPDGLYQLVMLCYIITSSMYYDQRCFIESGTATLYNMFV